MEWWPPVAGPWRYKYWELCQIWNNGILLWLWWLSRCFVWDSKIRSEGFIVLKRSCILGGWLIEWFSIVFWSDVHRLAHDTLISYSSEIEITIGQQIWRLIDVNLLAFTHQMPYVKTKMTGNKLCVSICINSYAIFIWTKFLTCLKG